jgi:hypothetical protein
MPPDQEAFRPGLAGVYETAGALFGSTFVELIPALSRTPTSRASPTARPDGVWTDLSRAG